MTCKSFLTSSILVDNGYQIVLNKLTVFIALSFTFKFVCKTICRPSDDLLKKRFIFLMQLKQITHVNTTRLFFLFLSVEFWSNPMYFKWSLTSECDTFNLFYRSRAAIERFASINAFNLSSPQLQLGFKNMVHLQGTRA